MKFCQFHIISQMIKKKINEKSVLKFLLENPNFFLNNPEILNSLKFPKNDENTNVFVTLQLIDK